MKWTDDEIMNNLKEGMANFMKFIEETKIGYLLFNLFIGFILIHILIFILGFFIDREMSALFATIGFMIPAIVTILIDSKHKNKNWW